jgi:hypothetical protein
MRDIDGQVRFIRLNTGEDIIAFSYRVSADEVDTSHYILNDPMKIVYMTTSRGQRPYMSISLMQWVFSRISEKQEFRIEEKDILFASEPAIGLVDYYYETVEHFIEMKERQKKEIQFGEGEIDEQELFEEDDEEMLDEAEGIEMLKELLNQTKGLDKKKLH